MLVMWLCRRVLCICCCCHQSSLWWWWWCSSVGRCLVRTELPYTMNTTINPVTVLLHEQHRPDFILVPWWCGDCGTSDVVACTVSRQEFQWKPMDPLTVEIHQRLITPEPQWPWRRVGCHASADNKSTCEQHEMSLSSCNWCSRAHAKLLRHWHVLLWSIHCCFGLLLQ